MISMMARTLAWSVVWSFLPYWAVTVAIATILAFILLQTWRGPIARKKDQLLEVLRLRPSTPSFPLFKLPPEIRSQIYSEAIKTSLMESPKSESTVKYMMRLTTDHFRRQNAIRPSEPSPRRKNTISSLLETSKLVNDEVADTFCLYQTVLLNVDTQRPNNGTLFSAPSSLLQHIRHLHLTIDMIPNMMPPEYAQPIRTRTGYDAPANFPSPSSWEFKSPILTRLSSMTNLQHLQIIIKATGDAMVNPVTMWHYVVSSLLDTSTSSSSASLRGLGKHVQDAKFKFNLESMPRLRPNWLVRLDADEKEAEAEENSKWVFVCREGHEIMASTPATDVRKFVQGLVSACDVEGCPEGR
jgi:hypothetical protein